MQFGTSRILSRIVVIAVIAMTAIGAWWWSITMPMQTAPAPLAVAHERIDPANEGRPISIAGELAAAGTAADPELGIVSPSVVLARVVEMYQWQESCVADACGQTGVWSEQRIDSSRFREKAGHDNPVSMPFASAVFTAPGARLGAFAIDTDVLAALATVAHPVEVRELPPNLAAIFRDNTGSLYSGEDGPQPAIGDLRVSYRVLGSTSVSISGVQRGERIVAVGQPMPDLDSD